MMVCCRAFGARPRSGEMIVMRRFGTSRRRVHGQGQGQWRRGVKRARVREAEARPHDAFGSAQVSRMLDWLSDECGLCIYDSSELSSTGMVHVWRGTASHRTTSTRCALEIWMEKARRCLGDVTGRL